MSKRTKRSSGNPANVQDPVKQKLAKTMRSTVELVQELEGMLTPDQIEWLRSCAVGLMFAHATVNNMPDPIDVVMGDRQMTPQEEREFTV